VPGVPLSLGASEQMAASRMIVSMPLLTKQESTLLDIAKADFIIVRRKLLHFTYSTLGYSNSLFLATSGSASSFDGVSYIALLSIRLSKQTSEREVHITKIDMIIDLVIQSKKRSKRPSLYELA
jgi:hypothetical protein